MKSGILLINKPIDWTSFDVVKKTKNILKTKKVGHTGTLDPFATGLLILLVNNATKLSQTLMDQNKEYIAKCKFGVSSNTGDPTGEIIQDQAIYPVHREDFMAKIPDIKSINKQTPSKFSAIKHNGKKAYQLARKNIDFELQEREIKILEFELIDFDFPFFTYKTLVSKGTYIRTLTEQIAKLFNNNALTIELCRTKIGNYNIKNSLNINEISEENIIETGSNLEFKIQNSELERNSVFRIPHSAFRIEEKFRIPHSELNTASVLTIGSFDGVHIGHQHLLKETHDIAKLYNTHSIVITFDKHPHEILRNDSQPYLLTEYHKREILIKETGINFIDLINFDQELSKIPPEIFLKNYIFEKYKPIVIVVGFDSHFGLNRTGNVELLKKYAQEYNYKVVQIPQFTIDTIAPKSSGIRKLIKEGKVDIAKIYLGRHYSIIGTVVHGKELGRKLGYPTINIKTDEQSKLIPQNGVYATKVLVNSKMYNSATNIGTAPTMKTENKIEIETFLFDFTGELYDHTVEIFFIEKIRDEKRFVNPKELITQINTDIETIKKILCITNH